MATLGRILSWWGHDYAYAAYWQVRGTLRPGRREEFGSGEHRPVVVLPGVWEPWGFVRPLIDALHGAGHPVHVVPALGRNSRPVADAARVVAGFLDERDLRDVVLVAHSKGGLVGKFVMSELDPDDRVTSMVAICTPFAGSDYARFMTSRTLRAFSPTDPTTLKLQADLEVNARITTIAGVFDPHIPNIVELEGATNIRVDDGGHFRLLDRPEVIEAVVEVAGRPAAVQEQIVDAAIAAATDASRDHGGVSDKPRVLFVCVHNAGRSQMAAGFLRSIAGDRVEVLSAGSEPEDAVNPVAVAAMAEAGIDIAAMSPRLLAVDDVREADVVVTMGCGDACPVFPGTRYEDWELDDPAGQPIEVVRPIRDEIRRRVEALAAELLRGAASDRPRKHRPPDVPAPRFTI